MRRALLAVSLLLSSGAACDDAPPRAASGTPTRAPRPERPPPPATRELDPAIWPDAARVVAIGDLHGDLPQTRRALRLAGAIDDDDRWIGGELVVVQVGDQTDRGDDERAILVLLERLRVEARAAGGALIALVGNHEAMNVAGDFRYVTPGGFEDFADVPIPVDDPRVRRRSRAHEGRAAAFRPGGPWARVLASHPVAVRVGPTLFVHGGLLPRHVEIGLEPINREVAAWMRGETDAPAILDGEDSPVWSRHFSDELEESDCALLERTLEAAGARRMVVAHTVQRGGITSACDERVFRVDVGLSRFYGGPVEVLEIRGGVVRTLRAGPRP